MASNVLMAKIGLESKLERSTTFAVKLQQGEIRLSVDRVALTVNVLTYAMSGTTLAYYKYFSVEQEENKEGWGRVPAWGTCTVVETTLPVDFPLGARFYGLVPLSSQFIAKPKLLRNRGLGFVDTYEHRKEGNIVYNTYTSLAHDAMYRGLQQQEEDTMLLLRPLFLTAWLLREAVLVLDVNVQTVVITSCSSKTGLMLAYLMKQSMMRVNVVGMTSKRNLGYCQTLGVFDRLVTYDEPNFNNTNANKRVCVVDFAGNVPVLIGLQQQFKQGLVAMLCVGASHVQEANLSASLTGEGFDARYCKPQFFFAPKYASAVNKANPLAMAEQMPRDWHWFLDSHAGKMLHVNHASGAEAIKQVLDQFVRNQVPAEQSWIGVFPTTAQL